MPRVLNKRTDIIPPGAVYVGRPSKWGNPYRVGRDGDRQRVIDRYRERLSFLLTHPGSRETLLADLEFLRGKDLVCWCAPLPCHADILLELANKEEDGAS